MVSFSFNLRGVVCALVMCTVTHGHTLTTTSSLLGYSTLHTATPASSRNVPSPVGHPVKPTATPVYSHDVPSVVEHSAAHSLDRRVRIGFCDDGCFQEMDGEARSVKTDFENHCSSFLRTTVGSTVLTATSTTIITVFDNNGNYSTLFSTISKSIESVQMGRDSLFTILPTHIPSHLPLSWPACADRFYKNLQPVFTSQFSSLCSCRGIMPITTTVTTATNTVIEVSPTILPFKLKVQFNNRTKLYLQPFDNEFHQTEDPATIKAMGFNGKGHYAPIFELTSELYLRSQSNTTLGWIPYNEWNKQINGKLVFIDGTYARKPRPFFPNFYIEAKWRGGKWWYHVVINEEDVLPWVVKIPWSDENKKLPDETFLWLQTYDQVKVDKEEYGLISDEVKLLAEPVADG